MTVLAVAQQALEKPLPAGLPQAAVRMGQEEYQLVRGEGGFSFPYELDYSQYKPRGHYTRSDHCGRRDLPPCSIPLLKLASGLSCKEGCVIPGRSGIS